MADEQFVAYMLSLTSEKESADSSALSTQSAEESTDAEEDKEQSENISPGDIDAHASRTVADIVAEYGFEKPQTGIEQSVAEAIASVLTATSYEQRFVEFVSKLGLQHFKASELLYMGGKNGTGAACAGKNKLPSEAHWPMIVPTVLLLDKIRTKLGTGIRITSAYRSKSYNTCIDGESRSFHMEFNAVDFQGHSAPVSSLFSAVTQVVGTTTHYKKRYGTFVHLDTRRRLPGS
ncbi:D-Ala-D-Ala carboxypeptidase family metallohydrolase [Paracoccus sp. T5]|uniref:D-Ala-D-Ala carboxypeptidase family metallohydrolase n=1 Tax=Paracoccus sp. T5 TaxID=3402161 RepID=UPI003AE46A86